MSGFTIMISGNTLNFWLAKEQINIQTIGIFALISLPYAINFIWAPIFDIKKIPLLSKLLGHRVSWIVVIQIFLSCAVYLLSIFDPTTNLLLFGIFALIASFLSSAQDTLLGAYRTEIVSSEKQGQISGIYIFGYRIGMLISSSLAIYVSYYIGWNLVYESFSVIIILFPLLLVLMSIDQSNMNDIFEVTKLDLGIKNCRIKKIVTNFNEKILLPIGNFRYILIILIFLILYRLPDNFIGMMINPFLIHIGYDEFEISTVGKFFGISNAIIGGLLAGFIMKYFTILRSLLFFGALHAIAHMFFIVQDIYGKNIELLFLVIGFESLTGGMAMAAYIGFIASLCKGKFKATQYSFLTSMMGISRSILPAFSGYIAAMSGWKLFYLFATVATIPSLILIFYLEKYKKRSFAL